MTLNEFLTKAGALLGLAEKSLPDTDALHGKLTEVEAALETAKAEISRLSAQIAELNDKAKSVEEAHRAEIERISQEHAKALDEKSKEVEAITSTVEERAAKRALEITASQGQPPIADTPADSNGKANSEVFGLAKVIAAFKAEQDRTQTLNR